MKLPGSTFFRQLFTRRREQESEQEPEPESAQSEELPSISSPAVASPAPPVVEETPPVAERPLPPLPALPPKEARHSVASSLRRSAQGATDAVKPQRPGDAPPAKPAKRRADVLTVDSSAPTTPDAAATATQHPSLQALDDDLRGLLNTTGGTLCRALRPPTSGADLARRIRIGPADSRRRAASPTSEGEPAPSSLDNSATGPVSQGVQRAESLEQRARGLLLETSLTPEQEGNLRRVLQDAQDLHLALRAARYAWQICLLLNGGDTPEGQVIFARIKRVTQAVVEINGRAVAVMEGKHESDATAVIAQQYRAFAAMQNEVRASVRGEHSSTAQLARAALWSLDLCAENTVRVAARRAMPEAARRASSPRVPGPPDINDGILLPLSRQ